jgi:hypothetical protein
MNFSATMADPSTRLIGVVGLQEAISHLLLRFWPSSSGQPCRQMQSFDSDEGLGWEEVKLSFKLVFHHALPVPLSQRNLKP